MFDHNLILCFLVSSRDVTRSINHINFGLEGSVRYLKSFPCKKKKLFHKIKFVTLSYLMAENFFDVVMLV